MQPKLEREIYVYVLAKYPRSLSQIESPFQNKLSWSG